MNFEYSAVSANPHPMDEGLCSKRSTGACPGVFIVGLTLCPPPSTNGATKNDGKI